MSEPLRILVVCTANRCRSPMAAAMLSDALARSGVEAVVTSAGSLEAGIPAVDNAIAVMGDRGLDITSHVSTQLSLELLSSIDLILTMERAHVRDVAVRSRDALPKTFTIKEFVRRAQDTRRFPGEPVSEWITRLSSSRSNSELLGTSYEDDIADPIGKPRKEFEKTVAELEPLIAAVSETVA